ncbi:DUF4177 domain-containing protein [Sporosalibacterium faouarense]|uniref:DUF4177 domain-containing protein n=1 Tax=Sporosalibacterium faouarense TaxID=516123 RepID=UPI00141D7216|nr:DUF4177 domain-containing protein [Sporosalibacterium faouarense]MTI49356.1 DUF4177 domain-containing protein [Bacillota bacterium]
MKKFEYKIVNFRTHGMVNLVLTKDHEKQMNQLGEDGWELVDINDAKTGRTIMGIFKREKND